MGRGLCNLLSNISSRCVTISVMDEVFILRDSQCSYPSIHMDKQLILPKMAQTQIDKMLSNLGYSQIKYLINRPQDTVLSCKIGNVASIAVREFRVRGVFPRLNFDF